MLSTAEESHTLASLMRLKSRLSDMIEPDFGLIDELLIREVVTSREMADVRSERTVYRRTEALLDLISTEDKCVDLLNALQNTGQQHVVNFITQNGGQ